MPAVFQLNTQNLIPWFLSSFLLLVYIFVLPADLQAPVCSFTIFQFAQAITPNIIMFLPRNVDLQQVEELSWLSSPPLEVEVRNPLHTRLV